MRLLFLCHAFNSLAQRLYVELTRDGHEIAIELDVNDALTQEAVSLWQPQLIVAPFLKRAIPERVWRSVRCLVVHPGIKGDRGPSSLDWAIQEGEATWGVTVLIANGEMDAGDIVASVEFPLREAAKSSVYRNELTEAAVGAVRLAVARLADREFRPEPLDYARPDVRGRWRPPMKQADRAIDWAVDNTATILRKIRAGDGMPGVRDQVLGIACHLFDAYAEPAPNSELASARPGAIIAQRDGAILRATIDGALWIGHLKRVPEGPAPQLKLPAAMVLDDRLAGVPTLRARRDPATGSEFAQAIRYDEQGAVGVLHFAFYNGAMGAAHCAALRDAVTAAKRRPTRVLLLAGGPDFWSNGIHLNLIEHSGQPAEESWCNINAMNDLVREIVTADRQITIAALQGNAGAGGCFLALAADCVYGRSGIVLNPHYKSMGNLFGSEYWTYLLPRRVGPERAACIVANRLPIGAPEAQALGLIDQHFGGSPAEFLSIAITRAGELAAAGDFESRLAEKHARRRDDEAIKPLEAYRAEELQRIELNFFGFDPSYHVARYHFVYKLAKARTPLYLAPHRRSTPLGRSRAA